MCSSATRGARGAAAAAGTVPVAAAVAQQRLRRGEPPPPRAPAPRPAQADAASDANKSETKDWVALELVDKEGKPASLIRFCVAGADGVEHSGLTDTDGKARVEGLAPGSYTVTFPDLHGGEWEPA